MSNFSNLNELDGLQFIPVNDKKQPTVKNWQTVATKHDLSNCYGVGLVCGSLSGNVEALDFDLKYDLTGVLFDRYKKIVNEYAKGLLKKVVVQKTKNGGYHLIYRCAKIDGNSKLANRATTADEKKETYELSYQKEISEGKTTSDANRIAEKAAANDKVRVLIETRGVGGQIVVAPTNGYEMIYGDLCSISEITEEERQILIGIATQFNEVLDEVQAPRGSNIPKSSGLSPFDDYNNRGDVVSLLVGYGWKVVGNKGSKTLLLRSGKTDAKSSGNYDHDKRWFSVFTTSTEFTPQKAYLPYAVFAKLECNDDFSLAAKKLLDLGYGEKTEPKQKEKPPSTRVIPSRIDLNNDDLSFLADGSDYDTYLTQVRDGTLEMGLTTGMPSLDEHFLFKKGNLVMTNGIDNTGKSVVTWYLYLLAAMYHGWKGIIFSSENTLGAFMRKMIQFYWGKPLYGKFKMTDLEFRIAKEFVEKHFKLIRSQEDLYNYKDIMNMVKKTRNKFGDFNFGMIDPYNSLKMDLSGFSKLSGHDYHYEALSEIKAYGQKTNFGWVVNNHAVTNALRAKDGEKKYPLAPKKEDTEGGGKFPNKADDFITIHRLTGHPTDWMVTEIHVRKIKDTETGGRPTSFDTPVKLEMYKGQCGFIERLDDGMGKTPLDPVEQWHYKNNNNQQELPIPKEIPKPSSWGNAGVVDDVTTVF